MLAVMGATPDHISLLLSVSIIKIYGNKILIARIQPDF